MKRKGFLWSLKRRKKLNSAALQSKWSYLLVGWIQLIKAEQIKSEWSINRQFFQCNKSSLNLNRVLKRWPLIWRVNGKRWGGEDYIHPPNRANGAKLLLRAIAKMGFSTLCLLFVWAIHKKLTNIWKGGRFLRTVCSCGGAGIRGGEPRIMRAEWEALLSRQRSHFSQ